MADAGHAGPIADPATTQEVEAVRSAARWLVGAAAAVIAAMLAGVQVSAVSKIHTDTLAPLVVAVSAGVTGLGVAATILILAAQVLVAPGWTLNRLAHQERTRGWNQHWLNEELQARRGLLVPTDDLHLNQLYRSYRALFVANVELREQGHTSLPQNLLRDQDTETVTYQSGNSVDENRLEQRLNNITEMASRIANTANMAAVHRHYRRLVRALPWLGLIMALSAGAFIWATTTPPDGTPLTQPIRVEIRFSPDVDSLTRAAIPATCAGRTIDAVALGGTYEEPVVTSVQYLDCTLKQVRIRSAVAAILPSTR
jgi:hypothetical protein